MGNVKKHDFFKGPLKNIFVLETATFPYSKKKKKKKICMASNGICHYTVHSDQNN